MGQKSEYLTDKSVLWTLFWSVMVASFGVGLWMIAPEGACIAYVVGLVFVILGVVMAVVNISRCCWYPVLADRHIVIKHFFLPGRKCVISYENILYARVAEFLIRRFDRVLLLTLWTKDGKKRSFFLMTRPDQAGLLIHDLLCRGVPDTYDVHGNAVMRKTYCSRVALVMLMALLAVVVALWCFMVIRLANPLVAVVTVLFGLLVAFLLYLCSYIVIDGRRIMLKYMVFRSRNLDFCLDDALDVNVGSGSHLSVTLKAPDKNGKSCYSRIVGLVDTDMIQEINAHIGSHMQNS